MPPKAAPSTAKAPQRPSLTPNRSVSSPSAHSSHSASRHRLQSAQPHFSRSNLSNITNVKSTNTSPRFSLPTFLPQTKLTSLPNGFRVASEHHFSDTATLGVWLNAGSAYETMKSNGVAHFLEHMIFKGTAKRTKYQLESEVENMGGQLNAYTSREHTVYFIRVFKDDIPIAVDILSDMVLRSKLEPDRIENERLTILREMKEVNTHLDEVIMDLMHETVFGNDPHAYPILGPEENIKSLKRSDLTNYIEKNYTAPRMVLITAGPIEHEQLHKLASESPFSTLSSQNTIDLYPAPQFLGGRREQLMPDHEEIQSAAQVILAFEAVGWSHPDYYVFTCLQSLMGSGDFKTYKKFSSPFFEGITKSGSANGLMTFSTPYRHLGVFGFYASTPYGRTGDFIQILFQELARIAQHLTQEELDKAKSWVKRGMIWSIDGTHQVCEDVGRQMLGLGRRMSLTEVFARLDAIQLSDVKRVVEDYFFDTKYGAVALTAKENVLPSNEELRKLGSLSSYSRL